MRLIILGALWGSSYVLIDIALRDFTAPTVAFGRQFIAASVLAPLVLAPFAGGRMAGRMLRLVGGYRSSLGLMPTRRAISSHFQ